MDNTSQRLNELIKLAALNEEDQENAGDTSYPLIARFYEEQPPPSENWPLVSENENLTVLTPEETLIQPPEYVMEILSEAEMKQQQLSSPLKKLKLFDPTTPPKDCNTSKTLNYSADQSDIDCQDVSPSEFNQSVDLMLNSSIIVCRRSKPSKKNQTVLKRFRLV